MITLLHPSRGRADQAFRSFQNWIKKSSGNTPVQHILSLDDDDQQLPFYKSLFKHSKIVTSNNTNVVEATNKAAVFASGEVLIYLSDDFDCPLNWDIKVLEKMPSGKALVKVDDCLQRFVTPVLTIPIMSRELYKHLGYFWHPAYRSMFVDEDLYWVCKNNGWIVEAPELKFTHNHCSNGKAENDETYRRSAANWDQGKEVFTSRKAAGFPL